MCLLSKQSMNLSRKSKGFGRSETNGHKIIGIATANLLPGFLEN